MEPVIEDILTRGQVWAVVGLSGSTRRPAYGVAQWLQRMGKTIVPVHPRADPVHGATGYASLADIPFAVDVVDVFVRSALAGSVVDQAVACGAWAVWLQLGVRDDAALERARTAGLLAVQDRCPHIEGPRRLGWPA